MHRRTFEFLGLLSFFLFCLSAAFLGGYYTHALSTTYPLLRWPLPGLTADAGYPLLTEAQALIKANFDGALPDSRQLEYGLLHGYVGALGDPYTVFEEPPKAEVESQSLRGEYGGVGVSIRRNEAGAVVLSPFPDSPAAAAGIREGDLLTQIDATVISATATLDEISNLVRGPIGTSVHLLIQRADGTTAAFDIKREPILIPSATWRMVDGQPTIGLIALSRFSDKTPAELRRAISELKAKGATHFVLDLRNNGGGLLDAAVQSAGEFLDGGLVLYETEKNGADQTYTAPTGGSLTQAPLAVLVNGNTASAAEILAGALLDRDRAPLIGQKTYGKGSVQFIFRLSDGSSLHVTAHKWFTPKRRVLDGVGLPPTLAVQPAADNSDAELARAVEYLNTSK